MRDLSQPTVPSRAFYDQLAVETEKRRQANPTATALDPHCGASTQLREELKAHIEALAPQIVALSQDIHAHPEVGYQEVYAADAVAKLLQAHGIEVERASFGMETSLRAQIGGEAASPSAAAASAPFMGRNALDAVTVAQVGMGLLRQHMLPSDRMHAVVTDGGLVPNVVPERAEMSVIVRSLDSATLRDLVARVEDVFRGAALATGCGMEILTGETTNEMPVRANGPLSQAWVRAQNAAGRTVLPRGVITEVIAAGTDFGNVSQRVPGIHPLIKIAPEGTALHTHEFATAAGSPQGDRAAVDGAWGLASVALDYLSDPQLRQAVRADFEASGGVVDVASFWD